MMKRYLGSRMDIYAAIVWPIISVGLPLTMIIIVLTTALTAASIGLALLMMICLVLFNLCGKQIWRQVYSWGEFQENGIVVKRLFSKQCRMEYQKCCDIGIGMYVHGIQNTNIGSREYYIYLSYDYVEEKHKTSINLLRQTDTCVKVGFDKTLYEYLLNVLPLKHATALRHDYEKMIAKSRM